MKKTQIALKDDVIFAFNNKKIHNLYKIVKILFSFKHKFPSFLEGALWLEGAPRALDTQTGSHVETRLENVLVFLRVLL